MEQVEYIHQLMEENKRTLMPLLRYLPWLEQKAGQEVSTTYRNEELTVHSVAFPVYDGTLMSFVREAAKNPLMDRNYLYIYTRNHIKTHEDERRVIAKATWKDWDVLRGILSKYVLGGRVKGTLWNEGAKEQIFYLVLKKMKEIIEYWDKPMGNL